MIVSGDILNCYLPRRSGSLKRLIMNVQASIFAKKYGVKLNHTAMIEVLPEGALVWEASLKGGVRPVLLSEYDIDALITITRPMQPDKAMFRMKAQTGKKYDFRSWLTYLNYLFTGKWNGKKDIESYSSRWFCSELVDHCAQISTEPWFSTPNHIYHATKDFTVWAGTLPELIIFINQQNDKN